MTTEAHDSAELRKARGAFFTPPEVCDFVVSWALRAADDAVLEPSCGEAAFMLAAAARLQHLGSVAPAVAGYELHEHSARRATELLRAVGVSAPDVKVGDFLDARPSPTFHAVVGNPPYVRFQGFQGDARAAGLRAALAQGVRLTNLASSWASFVIHSAAFLRPEGRMALVLPAELLSSNYAAEVRAFLLRRFASVQVVLFDRHVFPGVQTEALLLMVEGAGGTREVSFGRVNRVADLDDLRFDVRLRPTSPGERWTHALADPAATEALATLASDGVFTDLNAWGRISLGAVTGNNRFFTMSLAQAQSLRLATTDVVRISPPGSSHLRTLSLTRDAFRRLTDADERTLLFRPTKPSSGAMRYIRAGERDGVNKAYKCRIRDPWWRVPVQESPSLFFTYMNAQTPQLCVNSLNLRHLNSIHGLYLPPERRHLAAPLAVASLNSATMLSAEVVGRAYGGGILKMEPREAAKLAVPSPEAVETLAPALVGASKQVRRLLQDGRMVDAVSLVDQVLLENGLAVAPSLIGHIRKSRNVLAHRRYARGGKSLPPEN